MDRKHACLTTYLRDKSREFWVCLVVVGVNIARRLAKKMYLREEGTVDLDYVDRWLPRGTLFGEAVPHVEEYHVSNRKVASAQLYGLEAMLGYLELEELDMTPATPVRKSTYRGRGRSHNKGQETRSHRQEMARAGIAKQDGIASPQLGEAEAQIANRDRM